MSKVLTVIPARLESQRLPRKPLQLLAGRPLIEWVWRRVVALKTPAHVVIATDSEEAAGVCYAFGADVEMTLASHISGTERVAEVAARETYSSYDVVLNVQGDEPFVLEEHVAGAVSMVLAGFDIGTVATRIESEADYDEPSIVKVVAAESGRALYFSRTERRGLRHVGVYAYTPAALARWVSLPRTRLEEKEKLEQLRPLEVGLSIGVAEVSTPTLGIDTPHDLALAERRLKGEPG